MRHLKEEPPKKKKKGKAVVIVILSIFIIGFCIGAFMVARTLIRAAHEKATFEKLAAMVGDTDEVNEDGTLRKYDELYKQNPDFFGWLKVSGTKINYPVMYIPGDSTYYLHRDFYSEYSDCGMLFVDGDCSRFSNHYLIYGHHMNNGTMFGELPKYSSKSFYEDHKIIYFDTRYEIRDYEVVAAFETQIYPEDEEDDHFCYYKYKDLTSPEKFDEYVANVKSCSNYDTGVTPTYGDDLITLSTCNYHTKEGRFVVVARKVKSYPEPTKSQ